MSNLELILSVISITLLMMLLVSVVIIVFVRTGRERQKHEVEAAQARLQYEQELRKMETEITEDTLGKVGMDLHDNVQQLFTYANMVINTHSVDFPESKEQLIPALNYLDEGIQQLRLLSRTLNNDYIDNVGLVEAIDIEVSRIKALRRMEVHWQKAIGKVRLEKNQQLMIFRVFQEIIQNTLKHSTAKNIYIEVIHKGGSFELKVEDDGRGFDVENALKTTKSSGLKNIVKRAKFAGMDCTIISSPGKGSSTVLKKLELTDKKFN